MEYHNYRAVEKKEEKGRVLVKNYSDFEFRQCVGVFSERTFISVLPHFIHFVCVNNIQAVAFRSSVVHSELKNCGF